jgi:hypothetical protein
LIQVKQTPTGGLFGDGTWEHQVLTKGKRLLTPLSKLEVSVPTVGAGGLP